MVNWIEEINVFDLIFGKYCHPELLKRSQSLLEFLYKNKHLSRERIDKVFELAIDQHET